MLLDKIVDSLKKGSVIAEVKLIYLPQISKSVV